MSAGPVLILLSALAVGLQLYGLYRPVGTPDPVWFPHADKIVHVLGFALPVAVVLITLAWFAVQRGEALAARTIAVVVAVFAGHAVVSEVIQGGLYASRSGDSSDVLADWVGVGLGWTVFVVARPAMTRAAIR